MPLGAGGRHRREPRRIGRGDARRIEVFEQAGLHFTEEVLARFDEFSLAEIDEALDEATAAFKQWRAASFAERAVPMRRADGSSELAPRGTMIGVSAGRIARLARSR